jgi:hypothetical protein
MLIGLQSRLGRCAGGLGLLGDNCTTFRPLAACRALAASRILSIS